MDKYIYEAHDISGRLVNGVIEADSEESAIDTLKYNKLSSIYVKPYLSFDKKFVNFFTSLFGGIKDKDKVIFARQLAIMINAGLPLMEALREIARDTSKPAMLNIINQIIAYIEKGKTFSFALSQFPSVFSSIFVSMVRSGELSGKIDQVLDNLANQMERGYSVKSKVRSSLYYPAVIVFVLFGVTIFAITFIIPKLEDVFSSLGSNLPITTKFLIALSHAFMGYWYVFIVVFIALILAIRSLMATNMGKYYYAVMISKIPIVNKLTQGLYVNEFSKNLSLLIKGGVPIIDALSMIANSFQNEIIRSEIKRMIGDVEKGIMISQSLSKSAVFPPLVISMVAVGERTGKLTEVLDNIAKIYEEETDNTIKGFSSLIEPILMLVVGIGVGFIVLSIILPVYQISSSGF